MIGVSSYVTSPSEKSSSIIPDYNLEQHAADRNLKWSILRFLELVMRKDSEELADAEQAIEAIIDRYGSLTNGLHHFSRGTRA